MTRALFFTPLHPPSTLLAALLLLATSFTATSSAASEKIRVYVGDFKLVGVTKAQAGGLSPQFCGELSNEKDLDIDCEHDLRALAGFEGNRVLVGDMSGPGGANIMKRLASVKYVVRPELHNTKRGLMLVVRIGTNAGRDDGNMVIKKVIGRVVRKTGQRKMGPILNAVASISGQVAETLKTADVAPPKSLAGDK